MPYTIRIRDQITPMYVTRTDPVTGQQVERYNRVPAPANPQSFVRLIYSPLQANDKLIYEADPAGRTELWEDTAGTATMPDIDAGCPGFRQYHERRIRKAGANSLAEIATPYSTEERETWPYQREECLAYNRDVSTLTPFCDAIAVRRGIPRELFLMKVKENMDLFSAASAALLGVQQALIDRIYTVQTVTEIMSTDWPQEVL